MSKYNPLSDRLARHQGDEWRPSFAELEEVLGFPLPKVAKEQRTWWAGEEDKPHKRAWLSQGWRVQEVDRTMGSVVFRRDHRTTGAGPVSSPRTVATASHEVQPHAMQVAAEAASRRMYRTRAVGATAIVAGAVAVVVGAAMFAGRVLRRR